jgi:hypothetical protein
MCQSPEAIDIGSFAAQNVPGLAPKSSARDEPHTKLPRDNEGESSKERSASAEISEEISEMDRHRKDCLSPVFIGYCVIFKVREEAERATRTARERGPASRRRCAGLSKLNSMRPPGRPRALPCGLPGPVDVSSGRTVLRSAAGESEDSRAGEPARAAARGRPVPLVIGAP